MNAPLAGTAPAHETQSADSLMKLALAHHEAGRLREAGELYEQVLRIDPEHPDALHFSGLAAHQSGQAELAVASMTRAIEKEPGNPVYFLNFAQVLEAGGDLDRAIACYGQAISLDAGLEMAHFRLGIALTQKWRLEDAVTSLSQALRINPGSHQAAGNMGNALHKLGKLEEAIVCYRKAIALNPTYVEAHNNLGTVLHELSRFDEAAACYRLALLHRPGSVEAHTNLGATLRSLGKWQEAAESCRKALALRPDHAEAYLNLANALKDQGLLREAVDSYRQAIALAPSDPLAYTNLADTLVEQDRIDEAVASYRQAVEMKSERGTAYSNLLYLCSFSCHFEPAEERAFAEGWEKTMLSDGQREAARLRASAQSGAFPAASREGRKLRIGIVSAELGAHAVAVFLQPFLDELDRSRFHLTLFPTVVWQDARARHFRELADGYIPLIGVPDEVAADRIRAEKIDVLIDTTGHTCNCRLGILARRAAPVQCSYIGYWSTTGLTEMDWYITDEAYSGGCDAHFTERLWKLPQQAHCYKGDESLPESGWAPDPEGTVWLGSFNKYSKMRHQTLCLWARVLQGVQNTKLLLEDRLPFEAETHERILTAISSFGVAPDRVVFMPRVPGFAFAQHMALYDRLDIALDTIPFNSGTTAFDALWMGVPLVALEGDRVCGRMASSIVTALGHPEWAARNEEEYVSIVRSLAGDVEGRKQLRKNQRAAMMRSPLCDAKRLARSLEAALEAMYDRWLKS
jgi:predicted O-linked N-acetylglucosamine transferase (SPINDLY family)